MSSSPPVPTSAPRFPPCCAMSYACFRSHASQYPNPYQLPPGAVLVVGSGASGAQIAEELLRAGRRVYLSVGAAPPHAAPISRTRSDLVAGATWACSNAGGSSADRTASLPLITGAFGGNTIDFRRFAAEGVTLLGRMEAAHQGVIELRAGSGQKAGVWRCLLRHLPRHGGRPCRSARPRHAPEDPAARAVLPDPPCLTEPLRRLDLGADGIGAVIWATGYGFDFGWIDVPVLDSRGEPLHATASPTCPACISSACNGCPE